MANKWDANEEWPYLSVKALDDTMVERDLDDYNSLIGLRAIGSDLNRNNPVAAAFLLGYLTAFMGGKIHFDMMGPEYTTGPLKKLLLNEFNYMDINKLYDINRIVEYLIIHAFKGGDCLVHTPVDKERGDITTMTELISPNRIITPRDLQRDPLVRNGVQYSAGGRISGYYVKPLQSMFENKILNKRDFDFIPLYTKISGIGYRQNCYMFKSPLTDDFSSARAYPACIPSSKLLRHILQYIKSVVIGAHVAACFAGFITGNNPGGAKRGFDQNARRLKHIGTVSPGGIYFLRKGEAITFGSPSRPADNTDSLIKRISIISSASIRFPYEISQLHLENVSFSSWKGGSNEVLGNRNRWLNEINRVLWFISNNISQEAIIKGMIKGDLTNVKYKFGFPRYDPLDDEKKSRAERIKIQNGSTSLQRISQERNIDYEELQDEKLQEGIDDLELKAKLVVKADEIESNLDILLPEDVSPTIRRLNAESTNTGESGGRETKKRKGEDTGDLTEEEKRARRIEDGNY